MAENERELTRCDQSMAKTIGETLHVASCPGVLPCTGSHVDHREFALLLGARGAAVGRHLVPLAVQLCLPQPQ